SELLLGLVELLLGVFELQAELIELLGEAVSALPVAEAAGGEVAGPDLQGLVLGLAPGSVVLAGIAAAHECGDQDAGRGLRGGRGGGLTRVREFCPYVLG